MKTKEIDVWVPESIINDSWVKQDGSKWFSTVDPVHGTFMKAKLIIELPEKKVTITESEFEKAFNEFKGQGSADFYLNVIKEKLFSKSE